jgi:hypothetical protein
VDLNPKYENMKCKLTVVFLVLARTALQVHATPIAFNLRDTTATTEIELGVITRSGVVAVLTPHVAGGSGALNQTTSAFGINATGTGDDTDELDNGLGVESISMVFNTDIFFTELTLSSFPVPDTAFLTINGFSTLTLNATAGAIDVFGFATDNFVTAGQTVVLSFGSGSGFSFDSFTIEPLAVPDGLGACVPALTWMVLLLVDCYPGCRKRLSTASAFPRARQ